MNHYARADARLGTFSLRPLDVDADLELLHSWVTHAKAEYWMMQDFSADQVAAEYRRIAEHPQHDAFLGFWDGRPAFLTERYDPAFVELAGLYDAQPGDVGMHFLCAPAQAPQGPGFSALGGASAAGSGRVHGFTLAVITTVMAWLFEDPACQRVVVDPDIRNTAVQALNAAVGFTVVGPLQKPEKQALLSTCTRAQFLARMGAPS